MSQPEQIETQRYIGRLWEIAKQQGAVVKGDVAPARRCPALKHDESRCEGSVHLTGDANGRRACRPCPLVRMRSQAEALAELLAKCGANSARPELLSRQLLASIQPDRQVEGLARLIEWTAEAIEHAPPAGHTIIAGPCGLAKSHAELAVHFACLERGVDSRWVDSNAVRELCMQLDSFDAEDRARAQGAVKCLQRARVICFNDLADYESGKGERYRLLLGTLLEQGGAAWIVSTNHPVKAAKEEGKPLAMDLLRHPDIGERLVSRLTADRGGVPAVVINLRGQDQRRHQARLAHRAVKP